MSSLLLSAEGAYPSLALLHPQFLHSADVEVIFQFFIPAQFVQFQHSFHRDLPSSHWSTYYHVLLQDRDSRSMWSLQLRVSKKVSLLPAKHSFVTLMSMLWESITVTAWCICCSTSQAIAAVAASTSILWLQVVMSNASVLFSFVFPLRYMTKLQPLQCPLVMEQLVKMMYSCGWDWCWMISCIRGSVASEAQVWHSLPSWKTTYIGIVLKYCIFKIHVLNDDCAADKYKLYIFLLIC